MPRVIPRSPDTAPNSIATILYVVSLHGDVVDINAMKAVVSLIMALTLFCMSSGRQQKYGATEVLRTAKNCQHFTLIIHIPSHLGVVPDQIPLLKHVLYPYPFRQ